MTKRHLTIATRESPLALRQAETVRDWLIAQHPTLAIDFLGMTTQADKHLERNVIDLGGKGAFVKELEEALLDGRADMAVHSMKDVPMALPPGLCLPAITRREDPRDVFISNRFHSLNELPANASVGTSSLRRQTQLTVLRNDLNFINLRGNIHTRLKRLDQGEVDAIILAGAGLKRMHLDQRIRSYFSVDDILPAAGQGALGLECRATDFATQSLILSLNDPAVNACVTAERALCRRLNGGCHVPVAAYAHLHHGRLILKGLVMGEDGIKRVSVRLEGDPDHADSMGTRAADELIQQGAEKILCAYRKQESS